MPLTRSTPAATSTPERLNDAMERFGRSDEESLGEGTSEEEEEEEDEVVSEASDDDDDDDSLSRLVSASRTTRVCRTLWKVSRACLASVTCACSPTRWLGAAMRARSQVLQAHQKEGVRWVFGAHERGGGILTDEPGLGKTLQIIGLIEAL